jgi:hypothetical protein
MNTSPQSPRAPPPRTPRRSSTSVDGHPQAFAGDIIEPTSSFLRDALRERKGMQSRSRSSTPRRIRANARQNAPKDEWLALSGDEGRSNDGPAAARPARRRRASDLAAVRATPPVVRTMTTQEVETKMDRLEKESWDLKHRIMLYQERAKQLGAKLEEKELELERLKGLQETNDALVEELEKKDKKMMEAEADNAEITAINEELVEELDLRVKELQAAQEDAVARQSAIEEAAGIIQSLEQRIMEQQKQPSARDSASPLRADSDYFSADGDRNSKKAAPALLKPPPLTHSTAVDSDYFSADTSPLVTPRSTRHVPLATEKPTPLNLTHELVATFNREIGIRSITSKDSLFSAYLEAPALPPATTATARVQRLRSLRRRTASPRPAAQNLETQKARRSPHGWTNNRQLRSVYVASTAEPNGPTPTRPDRQTGPHTPQDEARRADVRSRSSPTISVTQPSSPSTAKKPAASSRGDLQSRLASSTAHKPSAGLARHSTAGDVPRASQPSRQAYVGAAGQASRGLAAAAAAASSANSSPASRAARMGAWAKGATTASSDPSLRSSGAALQPGPTQAGPGQQQAARKPTTETHSTAPNFAVWPRKYPAWPPSAGLLNRDVLFHGEGMDEMFGPGRAEGNDDRPW